MAWRPSIALRNFMLEGGPLKKALANCIIKVYTGAQPATAEAAPTGTLLVTYSLASGTPTREVQSLGSVDLTGGGSGSVNTLTVNSIEIMGSATAFNTSLAQTATDVITKINNNPFNYLFDAYLSDTDKINIRARPGLGALPNGWVVASTVTTITKTDANMASVASTVTTITKTDANMASGVSAANCLNWGDAAAGAIVKLGTETWSGVAVATGTAGWFRIEASVSDAGALDSSEAIIRVDGAVASTGAELNMTPTTITSGATQIISSFSVALPTV